MHPEAVCHSPYSSIYFLLRIILWSPTALCKSLQFTELVPQSFFFFLTLRSWQSVPATKRSRWEATYRSSRRFPPLHPGMILAVAVSLIGWHVRWCPWRGNRSRQQGDEGKKNRRKSNQVITMPVIPSGSGNMHIQFFLCSRALRNPIDLFFCVWDDFSFLFFFLRLC